MTTYTEEERERMFFLSLALSLCPIIVLIERLIMDIFILEKNDKQERKANENFLLNS